MTVAVQHFAWPANVQPKANRYDIPGVGSLVRVTHMLKATVGLGSEKLIRWSAKQEREACLDTSVNAAFDGTLHGVIQDCDADPQEAPARFREVLAARLGSEHAGRRKMEKAGDQGTAIHEAARRHLLIRLGADLPYPEPQGPVLVGFKAFVQWFEGSGLVPVRMEQTVWNETLGHAGTGDLFAFNPQGELEYWDIKTGSGIYPAHHLQATAYIEAARVEHGIPVVRGGIVRVPKSGPDLKPEVRLVGDLWSEDGAPKHRTHEQLMGCVRASQALWDCFCEDEE